MTIVNNVATYLQIPGNGATITFAFPFKIFQASDLIVGLISSGSYSQQTTGYTVTGVGQDGGGFITFATAPPLGTTVDLRSQVPETQTTEFANLGAYLPENTTAAFDKVTREVQDLLRQTYTFGIHGPDTEVIPWTQLPGAAGRANLGLFFDASGLPTVGALLGSPLTQSLFNQFLLNSPGLPPSYPQSPAEQLANVVPTNQLYPELNLWRYGGDPLGVIDSTNAWSQLFQVMFYKNGLTGGGGATTIPSGTYLNGTSLQIATTPASGPSYATHGITLDARGVVVNFTGTGVAFDFSAPTETGFFRQPTVEIDGMIVMGTASGAGAFRLNDISGGLFSSCEAQNFVNGFGFALRNTVNWCENTEFRKCSVVGAKTGIDFSVAGGTTSFSRTYVNNFFGANISDAWFNCHGGTAVYDSLFDHMSGNQVGQCIFSIGDFINNAAVSADMTGTVCRGFDMETNASPAGQCVVRLMDYPQNIGVARRPTIYNVNPYANNAGAIPLFADRNGTPVNLEPIQSQPFWPQTGLVSNEFQYGLNGAKRNVATQNGPVEVVMQLFGVGSPNVTGRVHFTRTGDLVCMRIFDSMVGPSQGGSMSMGFNGFGNPIPAEFCPPQAATGLPCFVSDNGNTLVPASISIQPAGFCVWAIATSLTHYDVNGFTGSGQKGLQATMTFYWSVAT